MYERFWIRVSKILNLNRVLLQITEEIEKQTTLKDEIEKLKKEVVELTEFETTLRETVEKFQIYEVSFPFWPKLHVS